MRQEHCEPQAGLLGDAEDLSIIKKGVLAVGLGIAAILLVVSLSYFPFHGFMIPEIPAGDPAAAMTLEGELGAGYVLQTDFISGRYVIPFLSALIVAGAVLLWVLRTEPGRQYPS